MGRGASRARSELAAEYVQRKVDIIVTWATGPSLAAKQATSTIPIVFALATDPVGSGLVTSLARPGGNVTGLSALNIDLIGKRIELLHEIAPTLRRIAILGNIGVPDTAAEIRALADVARSIGLDVAILNLTQREYCPGVRQPQRSLGRTICRWRSTHIQQSGRDHRLCTSSETSSHIRKPRFCRGWGVDVIWAELS